MRDPVTLQIGLCVKEQSDAVVNSLAIISNCFLEQLAKVVTKGKASLYLVHSTYSTEAAAEEYSVTMHLNSTFL